ncbi:Conserved hypothetical protein [Prochlorococcus marinus str. MIT 9313]|uniref:Uncharacterized protein n=1 Tax=Prochlorococcus marinus (strain MIT 9313) TaxID=74547 RepID=B9ES66_PROMM|nr:Conserved hypothetical protein [Prochlorococcus marinus str. MIT 9313]
MIHRFWQFLASSSERKLTGLTPLVSLITWLFAQHASSAFTVFRLKSFTPGASIAGVLSALDQNNL